MLFTGGFEAHFALPVEPCVPVPGVHLQDRLEFSAATIDATLHEGHRKSPYDGAGASFWFRQLGQYQGAGVLTGFGLRLRHFCAVVAFAFHGGFRAHLFSGPGKVQRDANVVVVIAECSTQLSIECVPRGFPTTYWTAFRFGPARCNPSLVTCGRVVVRKPGNPCNPFPRWARTSRTPALVRPAASRS
jgi:hypothetical protein